MVTLTGAGGCGKTQLALGVASDLVELGCGSRWLRRRTGIGFDPHWCRHTGATSLRDGVPIEVVSKLLGHADLTTTSSVYGHLTVEDARKALEQAGWFTGREVRL